MSETEGDPAATGTKGGGEWPDKDTPPTGPAPGTDPGIAAAIDVERADDTGPMTEANVEELYGKGDERAAVATMPAEERDRLLGDDAPAKPESATSADDVQAEEAPRPGDDAPLDEGATE